LDEYKAPVVATWQAGIGRVACYTGEADGKFTGAIAQWKDVGEFYSSLARWTAGPPPTLTDNMLVTQEVRGGVNLLQLHLDPDRKQEGFTSLPRVTVLRAASSKAPQVEKMPLRWTGPDTLAAEIPLPGAGAALATVEIPGQQPVTLPPVCLPYSPEFRPAPPDTGLLALDRLAQATGGRERVELAGIWKDLPRRPRFFPLAPWLLSAAVAILLVEILERRTGIVSRQGVWLRRTAEGTAELGGRWLRRRPTPVAVPPASPPIPAPLPGVRPPAAAAASTPAADRAGMIDALRQARQRSRGRGLSP
jgi:hypothetical protein